jgi:hypothetical protein
LQNRTATYCPFYTLTISGDDRFSAANPTYEDRFTLKLSTVRSDYLEVWWQNPTTGANLLEYAGLLASVGSIVVNSLQGNDIIQVDANIAASFVIHGGEGMDDVKLIGKGASALLAFEFQGETGDDDLTIDFRNGDPLPLAGFNFNFIGGDGQDDTTVIEVGGAQRTGWFVDTFTDAVDLVSGGRPDSSASLDDQITLRAAVQVANLASARTYIFLPTGIYTLSVIGTGGDNQGDLDISKNVRIIGTGAGEAIISAAGLTTPNSDRVFDVVSPGVLDLSRVTLTGGKTRTTTGKHGGAIQVGNGGNLLLTESGLVGNVTVHGGHGGGIYFDATGGGTILRCVITSDAADDISGGIYLASSIGAGGSVTVTETVIVNNADDDGINPDVHAGTNRTFTSGGNNRLGNSAAGFGVLGD